MVKITCVCILHPLFLYSILHFFLTIISQSIYFIVHCIVRIQSAHEKMCTWYWVIFSYFHIFIFSCFVLLFFCTLKYCNIYSYLCQLISFFRLSRIFGSNEYWLNIHRISVWLNEKRLSTIRRIFSTTEYSA